MSNVKNYAEQGGDKWVVNGTLEVIAEGQILINDEPIGRATNQEESIDSTIEELIADFNSLIIKLKSAGLTETK